VGASPAVPTSPLGPRWRSWIAIGTPMVVALLVMVPRLARAHFGLFDDPASLTVADQIASGGWGLGEDVTFGRFRPVYWLYFAAVDRLAGGSPQVHFAANALLLAAAAGLLAYLARRVTESNLAGWAAGMAFVLGGPVVESAFTLSKPELLQSLLILAWLWAAGAIREANRAINFASLMQGALFAALACTLKETGVLMLPAGLLLLLRSLVLKSPERMAQAREPAVRWRAVVSAGLGAAVALILAASATRDLFAAAGPQTGFEPEFLLLGVRAWGDWLLRDYVYLLPLALAWLLLAAWRSYGRSGLRLLIDCCLWALVWLAPYLSYRFTPEYYLLPLSLGVSLAVGVLIRDSRAAAPLAAPARRAAGILLLAAGGLLFLLTLPTHASNAAIQLAVDEANSGMTELVSEVLPAGATLVVNLQETEAARKEYFWQLAPMLTQVNHRADIRVEGYISGSPPDLPESAALYIVSPIVENQPYPSVRLGVYEHTARAWEEGLRHDLGERLVLLGEVRSTAQLRMIDSLRLFCLVLPRVDYCQVPNAPFDTRRFAAGWRLYGVQPPEG